MRGSSALFRVASVLLPALALTACPQLLTDQFYVSKGAPSTSGPPDDEPDASLDRGRATDAGSSGGSGGSASLAPDAGRAGDAGVSAPPDPIGVALGAALKHRYRFDADAPLVDSVGGLTATAVGNPTFSAGAAVLAGGSGTAQYIDLPNGLLTDLTNASFEVWLTWDVSNPTATSSQWQRIFDLGSNPSPSEGVQCAVDVDAQALFLTPANQSGKIELQCESCTGTTLLGPSSLAVGTTVQLVAVVDDNANQLRLYQNGDPVTSVSFTGSLSQITTCSGRSPPCDWNNWLGRSQHSEDPPFVGKILDFRVYSAALPDAWVQTSFKAGPDANW